MPFVNFEGRPFFFERRGSGPPLLFLGGTGGDLRRPDTRLEGPLTRYFDLLAYDQRGLGQSFKGDGPFVMADYADDAARLMDSQGWADATRASVITLLILGFILQAVGEHRPFEIVPRTMNFWPPGSIGFSGAAA